jgi:alanine-glyoxylate transaminase/serine-glyoxylate transaminase/serine-pyruvate transaminase
MIPGPVEVSPAVLEAFAGPPPGHLEPRFIDAFGSALAGMRQVWRAGPGSQPFVVAGGGTLAMDMAVSNLVEPGDRVLVAVTGYFSDRLVEMLRRQGAQVTEVRAPVGDAPEVEALRAVLDGPDGPFKALCATHVDTSTGVRLDPEPLARLARERDVLSLLDGVCATGGERFEMEAWGADVYLTASQKALGLPPGLALMVVSERALASREARRSPPPLYLDWMEWLPVMRAYEERRAAYFSTPATNLVLALAAGVGEILAEGVDAVLARHQWAARALRAAWTVLGLEAVPRRPELLAHTLSALRFPPGTDGSLVRRIAERGVIVAGGLHPAIRGEYFRVGHMGYATTRDDLLLRTVEAVAEALGEAGCPADTSAARRAASALLAGGTVGGAS